jgi:hypothetical protein
LKSPHQRFIETPHAKPFSDVAVSDGFQSACEYAMLQFVAQLPMSGDPARHWDCHGQLIGAKRFLEILTTIADPVEEKKKTPAPSLNWENKK